MVTFTIFVICIWLNIEYETLVTLIGSVECFVYTLVLWYLLGRK